MATNGKLEAPIVVPSGGWSTTVGGNTATIAAGTYYLSSGTTTLLAAIGTAFSAAATLTITATISAAESGTGIITITGSGAFTIAWVSTDLRDVLGFTANMGSATSHVSPRAARALWLPTRPKMAPSGSSSFKGFVQTDMRQAENASGYAWRFVGQSRIRNQISWSAIPKARVLIADETTGNQSFERFYRDNIAGLAGWCANPGKVRWYPSASTNSTYVDYTVMDMGEFAPEQESAPWDGLWKVQLGRLIGLDT